MYEILQQKPAADKEEDKVEEAREKSGRGKLISILVSRE